MPRRRPRRRRNRAALFAFVLLALVLFAVPAGAQPFGGRIGPFQTFGGLVNGSTGYPTPAPIHMGCFGPVRPGQTGHPLGGQTVEVFRPEVVRGNFGFTGSAANRIAAVFSPVLATNEVVTFQFYGVAQAIPTTLVLPCFGNGQVIFVPLPTSPTARAAIVPVVFVGQP